MRGHGYGALTGTSKGLGEIRSDTRMRFDSGDRLSRQAEETLASNMPEWRRQGVVVLLVRGQVGHAGFHLLRPPGPRRRA